MVKGKESSGKEVIKRVGGRGSGQLWRGGIWEKTSSQEIKRRKTSELERKEGFRGG